jgi:hypothetical protein
MFKLSLSDAMDSYEVYSLTGQLIKTEEILHSNTAEVNISDQNPGLYFVKIKAKNGAKACIKIIN